MSSSRDGYDPDFIGIEGCRVDLPTVGIELMDDVLFRPRLRDPGNENAEQGYVADYIHYSVVMSRRNRQALFSAANLSQTEWQQVSGRRWFLDPRIGAENQISNAFYRRNPWDRGHLTRRTAVTWGEPHEARHASNDSCSYANASLQHENFNQDEWRVPEKMVEKFDQDENGRLCVFTGPVFTEFDRWYTRPNVEGMARIPSAFWKVVAYAVKDKQQLGCQAYLMYQDANFVADKRGQHTLDLVNYQVTISELERLTGLEFPKALFDANPLRFFAKDEAPAADDRDNDGPEAFEAPRHWESAVDPDADVGVVFSRADLADATKKDSFDARRRTLVKAEFDEHLQSGGVQLRHKLRRRARRRVRKPTAE